MVVVVVVVTMVVESASCSIEALVVLLVVVAMMVVTIATVGVVVVPMLVELLHTTAFANVGATVGAAVGEACVDGAQQAVTLSPTVVLASPTNAPEGQLETLKVPQFACVDNLRHNEVGVVAVVFTPVESSRELPFAFAGSVLTFAETVVTFVGIVVTVGTVVTVGLIVVLPSAAVLLL
jgi:hypothetical protein